MTFIIFPFNTLEIYFSECEHKDEICLNFSITKDISDIEINRNFTCSISRDYLISEINSISIEDFLKISTNKISIIEDKENELLFSCILKINNVNELKNFIFCKSNGHGIEIFDSLFDQFNNFCISCTLEYENCKNINMQYNQK
jgi:hypothetical protein